MTTTTETSPHPKIARPRVPVRRVEDAKDKASCEHCDWSFGPDWPVITTEQAKYHRGEHRAGSVAVTIWHFVRDNKYGHPIGRKDGYPDRSTARQAFRGARYSIESRRITD